MDKEDREHFKTIGSALVAPPRGSPTPAQASASGLVQAYLEPAQDQKYLARQAETIFSCYRRDEVHNPEIYAAAVVAVLSEFPKCVIDFVVDPRTGITGTYKTAPSVAAIREACDNQMARIIQDLERERRIERQLREREEFERLEKANVTPAMKEKTKAWLDRIYPTARQLSREQPKRALSEEEKGALIESARAAGRELAGMALSEEAREIMRQQDQRSEEA